MYSQKAFDILKSSINSAVFIDERAKDFYSQVSNEANAVEEKLSVDLFKTFKENGKSLVVHKFETSNLDNSQILDYLFNGRDLILLDWELADVAGQEHSLKLLNRAVSTPYINFCCIYSSSANFHQIPLFLDAYFSGLSKEDLDTIKTTYEYIEPNEIERFLSGSGNGNIEVFLNENSIDISTFPIGRIREQPLESVLRYIYISLKSEVLIFPETPNNNYEVLNAGDGSFIINNTFVLTLKKDVGEDTDYNKLLKRISETVIKNNSSFFQLLGLEMQSVFNSNERFIDETILKSSTQAFFQFRNHLKDDKAFGTIIKKLLLEQATLKLRTAKLKLLDSDFLEHKSGEISETVTNEDLFQLNVFYNAVSVKSLSSDDAPNLNFGDVFKGSEEDYYLCITALCDCYEPKKIDYNFYFVKGAEFKDFELALMLGDTAFISFLPNGKAVYWGNIDDPQIKKIKEPSLSNSEDIQKLKNDIQTLKQTITNLSSNQSKLTNFLYKPFYIKPKVYNVENNKLIDSKMRIWDITNKPTKEAFEQKLNYFDVEYVTTLRNDYAQRIANHAFGHPARVGVDFVKIK